MPDDTPTSPTHDEMCAAMRDFLKNEEPLTPKGVKFIAALRVALEQLEANRWRDRVIDLLNKRVMDSRRSADWRVVVLGFPTPEEALEFHEAITPSRHRQRGE